MDFVFVFFQAKKLCGAPSWSDDDSQPAPPEVLSSPSFLEPSKVRVTPHVVGKKHSEKIKGMHCMLSTYN